MGINDPYDITEPPTPIYRWGGLSPGPVQLSLLTDDIVGSSRPALAIMPVVTTPCVLRARHCAKGTT